jgi:hypothetical protein
MKKTTPSICLLVSQNFFFKQNVTKHFGEGFRGTIQVRNGALSHSLRFVMFAF